jgi:hypothetical protein
VAEVDPWDVHLEAVTAALNAVTGGSRGGVVSVHGARGWRAEFRASRRSVTALLGPTNDAAPSLSDYRLAILYGLQFEPLGEPPPTSFAKTLTVQEGYRWDEQMIREVVLEAIAALRLVLGEDDAAAARFIDETRPGVSGVFRGARRAGRRR